MEQFDIYKDIQARTGGELYLGEPYIMGLNPKLNQRAEDFVPFFIAGGETGNIRHQSVPDTYLSDKCLYPRRTYTRKEKLLHNKNELYDELSKLLTEYENPEDDTLRVTEKDLYKMLCEIQSEWEYLTAN